MAMEHHIASTEGSAISGASAATLMARALLTIKPTRTLRVVFTLVVSLQGTRFMLRSMCHPFVIAALGVAVTLTSASDASAGHRHRRAKGNGGCCGTTVAAPVYSAGYSSSSDCGGGCGNSGGCGSSGGVSTGCCGGGAGYSASPYYSGQTTVSNRNYSTAGSSMYYPSNNYQGGYSQGGITKGVITKAMDKVTTTTHLVTAMSTHPVSA